MHSPWGMLYQIVHETGWSLHYLLWKVSRANIMLMMADRSNFKHLKPEDQVKPESGADLASRLKNLKKRGEI